MYRGVAAQQRPTGARAPRRGGSGIKIIGVADNFYGAREGVALPLYSCLTFI
jgi:hypothetical protein